MANQDLLKKSQTLKKKKRIGKTIFLAVFFLLLLGGVNYLFLSSRLAINTITVSGNHWVDSQDILESANKVLVGRYFYIYPKKSSLLYPKDLMVKQIQTDWPIISQISVNSTGFDSLAINITERPDDTVWCTVEEAGELTAVSTASSSVPKATYATSFSVPSKKTCWFADPTGYIFAPAPIFSSDVFPELDGLLPASPLGTQPFPEAKYQAITQFMGGLKEALSPTALSGSAVQLANLKSSDQYEVILNKNQAGSVTASTTPAEWKVILNTNLDPAKQINNLVTILSSSQFQKDFNENSGRLDYVDLRFDQKVFYKFK